MRRVLPVLVPLVAAIACGRAPEAATSATLDEAPALLVTLAPEDAQGVLAEGTRLVRREAGGAVQEIAPEAAAAGRARVAHDGTRVLYLARRHPSGPARAWVLDDPAQPARCVSPPHLDCSGADWLPDGRVVFAARPLAGGAGESLWVVRPGSEEALRITFSGEAREPCVLRDGRVVFVGPHAPTSEHAAATALFTVHPDGSGFALLHHGLALAPRGVRPRQQDDGAVVVRTREGRPARLAWSDPRRAAAVDLPTAGTLLAWEPAAGGPLLAVRRPDGTGVLLRVGPGATARTLWVAPPGEHVREAVAVATTRRPQGHLSRLDEAGAPGTLLCLDARAPATDSAARVRLRTADGEALPPVRLADDGSFFVRVPSDVPLTVEVLAEDGSLLRASHTPFWVRPGEVRGCIGCHEPPDQAPPNRRPAAIADGAVDLTVPAHEARR